MSASPTTSTEEIDSFLRDCFADHLSSFPVLQSPLSHPDNDTTSSSRQDSDSTTELKREKKRIHVTLTYAQSLDAKIAGKDGKQLILSGKESMAMTHRLRAVHTAILVGIGTLLNDDPQLNCRIPHSLPVEKQPQPYILDANCRTPITCKLIKNAQSGIGKFPIICCSSSAASIGASLEARIGSLRESGCTILPIKSDRDGRIDIPSLLNTIAERNEPGETTTLMVEGGSKVISSFMYSGMVDSLIVTISPTLVGDDGVAVMPSTSTSNNDSNSPGGSGHTMPILKHRVSKLFGRDTVVGCDIERAGT